MENEQYWCGILAQVRRLHVGGGDANNRDGWLRLAISLKSADIEPTCWEIFHTISQNSEQYKGEKDCWNTYRRIRQIKKMTPGTVLEYLKGQGVDISHGAEHPHFVPDIKPVKISSPAQPAPLVPHVEPAQLVNSSTTASAYKASPLVTYLRKLHWGGQYYDRIAPSWTMYKCGYEYPHDMFRYIDVQGRTIFVKRIIYDNAGHRSKDTSQGATCFCEPRYQPCFFGEHLTNMVEHADKPIGIVESEKTALVMSIAEPAVIWLASGGADHLDACAARGTLKGRAVMVYPDVDAVDKWRDVAHKYGWECAADVLAWYIPALKEQGEKSDLADWWVHQQTEWMNSPSVQLARELAKTNRDFLNMFNSFKLKIL